MARWLIVLAVVFGMGGAARVANAQTATLEPSAYTREVARALTAALPSHAVAIAGDFALAVRHPDGRETQLALGNLYGDYQRMPAALGAIVGLYTRALSHGEARPVDRARIVPVIRERGFIGERFRAVTPLSGAQDFLFDDFNGDLVIVYAEDGGGRPRYLMAGEDLGVAREGLRKLATENLTRLLPKIELRTLDEAYSIVSAGGDYEASLLTLDSIWSSGQIKVDGEIVVAVPAKDTLLITGSRNEKGLATVARMAGEIAGRERYGLIPALFVYRGGRFVRFTPN